MKRVQVRGGGAVMNGIGRGKRIGILGGGPSALFVYKRLIETAVGVWRIEIFEARSSLGSGMPYSRAGANGEHITNVSGNEIPELVTAVCDWLRGLPQEKLDTYGIDRESISEYKVFPRLLFGDYLQAQFNSLRQRAENAGVATIVHFDTVVADVADEPARDTVLVRAEGGDSFEFDTVIICTGHHWPRAHEGVVDGFFDSPYPPSKLQFRANHPVAVRGSSLTAIDAIRTLARHNGTFQDAGAGKLKFVPDPAALNFKVVMHSRSGLLPCIRFHLDDPHQGRDSLLPARDLAKNMEENQGFLALDYVFERGFKDSFREKDPAFYELIKGMSIEQFVEAVMSQREHVDPFVLFEEEYKEAEKSIELRQSVYWKEMLGALSFAMNYPAKHFSAEDMLRLQRVLMPLISIVIAYVPQSSCAELIALHAAGQLELVAVGADSWVEPDSTGGATYNRRDGSGETQATRFETYIDCSGQPHLSIDAFPFRGLVRGETVVPARLRFRSDERGRELLREGSAEVTVDAAGACYLSVPGIAISDHFQALDRDGVASERVYVMAVPFIGGYNPDYSGLDFCEAASKLVVQSVMEHADGLVVASGL